MTDVAENSDTRTTQADARVASSMSVAEAKRQIQELTCAVAARDRFIGHIAHELRNSLAPMVLITDQFGALAEGSQPPGKMLARVAMLTSNLQRLMSTVSRIVDVADLRRGKLQLEPTSVDLVAVIEEVCRELEHAAATAGAALIITARGPVVGQWDRARVKQIASNLVTNAIRHGCGGGVELSVRGAANLAELEIRDHGPGLDGSALPWLFDCFDQVAPGRARGLGIGLWVVKTLCTAMGGSVAAENCSDGGARFCVVLPRG